MIKHQSQIKYSEVILLSLCFLLPALISAETVVIEIDTGTENINALEGTLQIPADVSVDEVFTGNSAILMWIVRPIIDRDLGIIAFAGITPGGFRGRYPLFSISGEFEEGDLSRISFTDLLALRNDGEGTSVPINLAVALRALDIDVSSPEPFVPEISSSPEIFEGSDFISFVAQDKGVGIERYEVAFGWLFPPGEKNWMVAESPLVLSRLQTFQRIHIRAIDIAGNFTTVSLPGPYHYAMLSFCAIIFLLCVILVLKRLLRPHS